MELTTKTAKELKLAGEYISSNRYKEGYAHGSKDTIINFKNELKEIMVDKTIKPDKYKLRDIRQLIQEIESVEK